MPVLSFIWLSLVIIEIVWTTSGVFELLVDLPERSGEHQPENHGVFHGQREQAGAGVSA
jgi:hypothetical protein